MNGTSAQLRASVLDFIQPHALATAAVGRYRYAAGCTAPTLYSSTYAAMARHLLGDFQGLPAGERAEWVAYLQGHQDDDGLFRDPVIFDQGWFKGDPLDCGRPHLTCHVVAALACLGGVAAKPIAWLGPWCDADALVRCLVISTASPITPSTPLARVQKFLELGRRMGANA